MKTIWIYLNKFTNVSLQRATSSIWKYITVSISPYHLYHRKYFLFNNGNPEAFLDRCIRIFLDCLFSPPTHTPNFSDKNIVYFSLPFTGPYALHIRTQLNKLCSSALPQISLRFKFQSGLHSVWFLSFRGSNSHVTAIAYCQQIYVSMLRSIVFEQNTAPFTHSNLGTRRNFALNWYEIGNDFTP